MIKKVGSTKFSFDNNEKPLSQIFTIDQFDFWLIFAPEMSWRHLTSAINTNSYFAQLKLFLAPFYFFFKIFFSIGSPNKNKPFPTFNFNKTKKILCVALTQRMFRDVLLPVIKELNHTDSYDIILVSDSIDIETSNLIDAKNISLLSFRDSWNPQLKSEEKNLNISISKIRSSLNIESGLGIVRPELSKEVYFSLKRVINLLLKWHLPNICRDAIKARYIFTKYKPDLILTADTSDSRNRLFTLLAKEFNALSVNVQFGLAGKESVEYRFHDVDYYCVWGESSRQALINQKVPKSKILITGSPRHDFLYGKNNPYNISPLGAVKTSNIGMTVLLASTYTDKTHNKYANPSALDSMKKAILEASKKFPNITLIIKTHPVESLNETKRLAGLSNNIFFANEDCDIRNLISMCNVFISFGSTATIDALLAKKIIVCPIFPGWPFSDIFRRSKFILTPRSAKEINQIFSAISSGDIKKHYNDKALSEHKAFLKSIIYKKDRLSAMRITKTIISLTL